MVAGVNRYDRSGTLKECPCKENFYDDGSNMICATCDKSCLTCSGSTQSSCLSCPSGANRDNFA
jgi:hypothetical protein